MSIKLYTRSFTYPCKAQTLAVVFLGTRANLVFVVRRARSKLAVQEVILTYLRSVRITTRRKLLEHDGCRILCFHDDKQET
jgi:hypothetical protein